MALGAIAVLRRFTPKRGSREVLVEITGEASYTTGGVVIAASNFGLNAITRLLPFPPYPLVDRTYVWDNTNSKLMAQVISTGLQVAGAVSCSADKIVCLVIGR
jgi:hypothetical protein